ncbi:MAG: TIGR03751 family conjugal transfer lipoprotein [Gammaproteobacteria bacterium]|nr:TIGR03751 family conjugal transfer lipoprotein [Gammaproteobacteria bacterium]
MRLIHLLCLISISSLGGCGAFRQVEAPVSSPTMQQIYQSHFERQAASAVKKGDLDHFEDQSELSYEVASEIETTFPILDNPMLIMYVYPHVVTEERLPVPGYWTVVPMYERTEFAEPGEHTVKKSAGN